MPLLQDWLTRWCFEHHRTINKLYLLRGHTNQCATFGLGKTGRRHALRTQHLRTGKATTNWI